MNEEVKKNPPAGGKKSLLLLEVSLIETAFVILALFLIFGILNYFNILSIYKLYPQQLGWLPHRPEQTKNAGFNTPKRSSSPFFLFCPLPKEFCSKGQIVFSKSKYYQGLGFNVPEKTPLLAPFSGTYEIFEQKNTNINSAPFMLLEITTANYSVFFIYPTSGVLTEVQKAELKKPQKIKQGEQMVTIPKGEVSIYGKIYNLVFYVNREEGTAPPVVINLPPDSLSQKVDLNSYK